MNKNTLPTEELTLSTDAIIALQQSQVKLTEKEKQEELKIYQSNLDEVEKFIQNVEELKSHLSSVVKLKTEIDQSKEKIEEWTKLLPCAIKIKNSLEANERKIKNAALEPETLILLEKEKEFLENKRNDLKFPFCISTKETTDVDENLFDPFLEIRIKELDYKLESEKKNLIDLQDKKKLLNHDIAKMFKSTEESNVFMQEFEGTKEQALENFLRKLEERSAFLKKEIADLTLWKTEFPLEPESLSTLLGEKTKLELKIEFFRRKQERLTAVYEKEHNSNSNSNRCAQTDASLLSKLYDDVLSAKNRILVSNQQLDRVKSELAKFDLYSEKLATEFDKLAKVWENVREELQPLKEQFDTLMLLKQTDVNVDEKVFLIRTATSLEELEQKMQPLQQKLDYFIKQGHKIYMEQQKFQLINNRTVNFVNWIGTERLIDFASYSSSVYENLLYFNLFSEENFAILTSSTILISLCAVSLFKRGTKHLAVLRNRMKDFFSFGNAKAPTGSGEQIRQLTGVNAGTGNLNSLLVFPTIDEALAQTVGNSQTEIVQISQSDSMSLLNQKLKKFFSFSVQYASNKIDLLQFHLSSQYNFFSETTRQILAIRICKEQLKTIMFLIKQFNLNTALLELRDNACQNIQDIETKLLERKDLSEVQLGDLLNDLTLMKQVDDLTSFLKSSYNMESFNSQILQSIEQFNEYAKFLSFTNNQVLKLPLLLDQIDFPSEIQKLNELCSSNGLDLLNYEQILTEIESQETTFKVYSTLKKVESLFNKKSDINLKSIDKLVEEN